MLINFLLFSYLLTLTGNRQVTLIIRNWYITLTIPKNKCRYIPQQKLAEVYPSQEGFFIGRRKIRTLIVYYLERDLAIHKEIATLHRIALAMTGEREIRVKCCSNIFKFVKTLFLSK